MIADLMLGILLILLFPGCIGTAIVLGYKAFTASDKRANFRNTQLLDNERMNIENRKLELEIMKEELAQRQLQRGPSWDTSLE